MFFEPPPIVLPNPPVEKSSRWQPWLEFCRGRWAEVVRIFRERRTAVAGIGLVLLVLAALIGLFTYPFNHPPRVQAHRSIPAEANSGPVPLGIAAVIAQIVGSRCASAMRALANTPV